MRILFICVDNRWIIYDIAQKLQQHLSASFDTTILTYDTPGFASYLVPTVQRSYDVIHMLSPGSFYRLHKIICVPCVATIWHMVDWTRFDRCIYRADTIFTGSLQWLQLIQQRIPVSVPIYRMGYGVDTSTFKPDQHARTQFLHALGLEANTVVFGFTGATSSNEGERKGLDRLWECLRSLKKMATFPFILRISGLEWSSDMVPPDLRHIIHLEHYLEKSQMPQLFASLDYYLCMSRIEGVPYPVIEAMSCGRVVLATPVGVVPEIMQHGQNGFVLSEENIVRDFMTIVMQTVDQPLTRAQCGEAARRTIIEKMDWNRAVQADRYRQMYTHAIAQYSLRPWRQRLMWQLQAWRMTMVQWYARLSR